ncbi:Ig-like domain-containing protein (plasmid) [Skermanella mucosa]|uniref:Ig-like domain-containing protein n=1 Tax=Skermanella mucosa TaxID=1789672 RepID=UPI00192C7416|nr:Ig-like domain-containing protein [Skermanella mucosa]UEM25270.1 Ig-like domain-containing protein [Skermanella mucosa]
MFAPKTRALLSLPVLATMAVVSLSGPALAQQVLLEPDQPAHLTGFGGKHADSTFPRYYSDRNGIALELCTQGNDLINACIYDPVIAGNTFSESIGFGAEAFWWAADSSMPFGTGTASLVLAVEAAFAAEDPIPGDEFAFGRVRMRIDVPEAGTYKVTYPFGEETFTVDAPGVKAINTTLDTGTFSPDGSGPLKSLIGAFLVWDTGAPPGYVGDGATPHKVTGSPGGFNKFRVEKVGGGPVAETDLFVISGKKWGGQVETPLGKRRVTYDGYRLEVLASSAPNATVTASYGAVTNPLVGDGRGFFYLSTPVTPMPKTVTIKATQPGNTENSLVADVSDIVNITEATYDPDVKTLTVAAKSSMSVTTEATGAAVLKVEPFGTIIPVDYRAEITGITVPPAHVKVTSSYKGSELKIVTISNISPPAPSAPGTTPAPQPTESVPVASLDSTNTPINTNVVVNVLANDTDADGLNPASIQISTPPTAAMGTIGLMDIAGIQVKPATGYTGTITFEYTVADTKGNRSAPAKVSIEVIAETINVAQAEYRSGDRSWRIRGTTNAVANNTITATLNGTALGSAAVDATGAFDIRVTNAAAPGAGAVMALKSSKGTTVSPVGYTTRR